MTEQQIDELFALTLLGNYDDDPAWDAVTKLHMNGSQSIFEKASAWCQSPEPLKRSRGADILCQLRDSKTAEQEQTQTFAAPIFVAESFQIISRMIDKETDERALTSELYGLGHLGHDGCVPLLVPHATHHNEEIRYAVTWSLGTFPNDPLAIESLIKLSEDSDEEIRNWALLLSPLKATQTRQFYVNFSSAI